MSLTVLLLLSGAVTAVLYVLYEKFVAGSGRVSSVLEQRVSSLLRNGSESPKPSAAASHKNSAEAGTDHFQNYVDQITTSRKIANWLLLAGIKQPLYQVLLVMIGSSVASFGVFVIWNLPLYLCAAIIVVIWAAPYIYFNSMRNRYIGRFLEQLPNALGMMANTVMVGQTADSAIKLVTEVIPNPLAAEFDTIHKEMTFGASFGEALKHLQDRIPSTEVRILVAALAIQQRSGGNLAEILRNLEAMIRDYNSIKREAKAMTAEGKVSLIVMCILPLVVMGVQIIKNPEPFFKLIVTSQGQMIYGIAGGLMLVGALLFHKITQLEDF